MLFGMEMKVNRRGGEQSDFQNHAKEGYEWKLNFTGKLRGVRNLNRCWWRGLNKVKIALSPSFSNLSKDNGGGPCQFQEANFLGELQC